MGSLDSALLKKALARGVAANVQDDKAVAIRIKHVGTGSITSVTITTATNLVFVSDGYTQTYAFGSLATIGALVDAINSGNCTEAAGGILWEAKVLDSIRSEATASQFVDSTVTASIFRDSGVSTTVYDILVDTDAADYFAYRLTFDRGFDKTAIKKSHRVHLQEFAYYLTMGTASTANAVRVYEVDGNVETQVYGKPTVATVTLDTINFASGEGKITADCGKDLVVYVVDAAITGVATNFLRVIGELE